jgi:hypothetical protein
VTSCTSWGVPVGSPIQPSLWQGITDPVSRLSWCGRVLWICAAGMSLLVWGYMFSWVPSWHLNVKSGTQYVVISRMTSNGVSVRWRNLTPPPSRASLSMNLSKGPETEGNGVLGGFRPDQSTVLVNGPGVELCRGKTWVNETWAGIYVSFGWIVATGLVIVIAPYARAGWRDLQSSRKEVTTSESVDRGTETLQALANEPNSHEPNAAL